MGLLSRWAVNKPKAALLAYVLLLVVIGILGTKFAGEYNDSFELPDTESTTAQELLQSSSAASESAGGTARVVWSSADGPVTSPTVEKAVTPTLESLAAAEGIACVAGPYGPPIGDDCPKFDAPTAAQIAKLRPQQQAAMQKAMQAGQKASSPISPDGSVAYATITFTGAMDAITPEVAKEVLTSVKDLDGTDGLTVGASGGALGFASGEPPSSEGIGILVALVILLIAFGSIIAAGLPILVAVFGLAAGLTLVTFAARFVDVATFGPTLAAMIGLGVGIDYALFILNRFRQASMAGHEPKAAALEAVNTAGRAVSFAGITVIIALLGLMVLRINFFNGLAVASALTVLMVMLSALWLLPALLGLLGAKTLGWRMPWARKQKTFHPEGGAWAKYGRFLQKMPVVPFIASLAVVLLIASPILGLRLGFADDGGRPAGSELRTGYDLMAQGFGPGVNGPFFIAVDLPEPGDSAALAATITAIDDTPGVAATLPTAEMLPLVIQPDTKVAALQVIPETAPQDEATTQLLERMRETSLPAVEQATGAQVYVGGFQAVTADFTTVLTNSMPLFLSVVVGLGFVALVILFRSLVVPLTAAITSLLSLAAAMGITTAVFQNGTGASLLGVTSTGPIFPFLPVMVFAILFGLSMDYQVFLVSRMQEEWGTSKDNLLSVRRGLAGSGRVVAIAAAIMASVFLAFIPTPTQEIKLFGVALASAVIIDAFIVRLIMVPSLMSMLGSANWWLPGWLGKILPTISVEGGGDEITDDEPELATAR